MLQIYIYIIHIHRCIRHFVCLRETIRGSGGYSYILYISMGIHQLWMSEGDHTYNRSRLEERSRCSFGYMNPDAHFGSFRGLEGAPTWDVSPN